MQTIQITNDNIQSFFLTPEQIKQAEEMRKKEETERYWMRIDHVLGDVQSSHEMNEDLGDEE